MKAKLLQLWQARTPRERAVLVVLAGVVVVAAYATIVQSAIRARDRLGTIVATLRQQAQDLNALALEYERVKAAPPAVRSRSDLRALLQAQAGAVGISNALLKTDSVDENEIQVAFGAVPFARWLSWVANLQAQQVRLATCRIEALAAPGMVSVTATFQRGR